MFRTLLSRIHDHRHPIFIAATANDISRLPRPGEFQAPRFVKALSITRMRMMNPISYRIPFLAIPLALILSGCVEATNPPTVPVQPDAGADDHGDPGDHAGCGRRHGG